MTLQSRATETAIDAAVQSKPRRNSVGLWLSTIGITALFTYSAIAFLLGESYGRLHFDGPMIALISFGCFLLFDALLSYCRARTLLSDAALQGIAHFTLASLIGLMTLDFAFTAYLTRSMPFEADPSDPYVSVQESLPARFYPTKRNFRLLKPGLTFSGSYYGNYYQSIFRQSPTLMKVISPKTLTVRTDELGFREDSPINTAQIFALGDSFTFGWALDTQQTWVEQLQEKIGMEVFNLGSHDSSPRQEVELLKYVVNHLKAKPVQVIWQLYEGNDLEDSYSIDAPVPSRKRMGLKPLLGTLLQNLKDSMVIEHFRTGRAKFSFNHTRSPIDDQTDGMVLAVQLYSSRALGLSLFHPLYIQRASEPESYVLNHENRPALERVFDEMSAMSSEHKFKVTVVIAPTAARLHGPYFEGFPRLSREPYFMNYITATAQKRGFGVVNLYDAMLPCAGTHLFYYRDDDHWNPEGSEYVAHIIAKQVFGSRLRSTERGEIFENLGRCSDGSEEF